MQENECRAVEVVYSALRSEILHNHDAANAFFIVAVTATAAIIGVGLKDEQKGWSILLAPFAILIPAFLLIYAKMWSTIRIASFLKLVVEPLMKAPSWEASLDSIRRYTSFLYGSLPDWSFYLALALGLGGLGLFCAGFAYKRASESGSEGQRFFCAFWFVVGLGFLMFMMSPWFCGGIHESIGKYESQWRTALCRQDRPSAVEQADGPDDRSGLPSGDLCR
jgi:hypothetical protein